jgi:translation initiation factor 4A
MSQDFNITTSTDLQDYPSFEEMSLKEELLRGIYAYGFEKPSAIQQKAIVPFANGMELIAQAQSGTGKTGTFSIGLLQMIDETSSDCQAIIILPTRDLSYQVSEVIASIGQRMKVGVLTCVGGTDWRRDVDKLNRGGIHVVVGTPGRIYDLLMKGAIVSQNIKHLVLDEADEMLDKDGFQDALYDIFQALPAKIHVGLYSATMSPEVLRISDQIMENPVKIIVKNEELTLEGIQQFYVALEKEHQKFDVLCDLYSDISINSSIIFCNSRRQVDTLTEKMLQNDFTVSATHGGLSTQERNDIMDSFRRGSTRVLITTDLLARGIDVQTVSVVINYDLPKKIENYIHRIGRSGRYGRKGLAINLVTSRDTSTLRELERFYDIQVEELPANVSALVSF